MSPELELEVKVKKFPETQDDLESEDANRIIGKNSILDLDLNDESKFEYRKIVIRLSQVEGRGDFDGFHTILYLPWGVFLARIPFEEFNMIYENLMNLTVKRITDYRFNYVKPEEDYSEKKVSVTAKRKPKGGKSDLAGDWI